MCVPLVFFSLNVPLVTYDTWDITVPLVFFLLAVPLVIYETWDTYIPLVPLGQFVPFEFFCIFPMYFMLNILFSSRSRKRTLDDNEILQALLSYEDDDESSSLESMDDSVDDRDYEVNEEESTESESSDEEFCEREPRSSRVAKETMEEREDVMDDGHTSSTGENEQETSWVDNVADIDWSIAASEYKPLFELSAAKNGVVMCPLDRSATPFDAKKKSW